MRGYLKIVLRWRVPIIGIVMLSLVAKAPSALVVILGAWAVLGVIATLIATEGSWVAILLLIAVAYPFAWVYDEFHVGGLTTAAYLTFGAVDFIATLLLAEGTPRRALLAPFGFAWCVAAALVAAAVPVCQKHREFCVDSMSDRPVGIEQSPPSPYPRVRHWLVDSFGIGHRIDADRSVLLLRHAAPENGGPALPHIKEARVEQCACRWLLAEVYSDADPDFRAYGSRFDSEGVLTVHRWFGVISGTERAPGSRSYTMPDEQWARVRGTAELPCAICLEHGQPAKCPRLSLSDGTQTTVVRACNGWKDFDDAR